MPLTKVDTQLLSNGFTTDSSNVNTISNGNTRILATAAGTSNDRKLIFQNELGTQATMAMGTTGSAAGVNKFYVQTNAGYSLTVDASGYVQMPYQVHFQANSNSTTTPPPLSGSIRPLIFTTVSRNNGSCYNSSNGRFTAPVTGLYAFTYKVRVNSSTTYLHPALAVNGGDLNATYSIFDGNIQYKSVSHTHYLYLTAGDYVNAVETNTNLNGSYEQSQCSFGGYLLS